jgi:hypothetical protein
MEHALVFLNSPHHSPDDLLFLCVCVCFVGLSVYPLWSKHPMKIPYSRRYSHLCQFYTISDLRIIINEKVLIKMCEVALLKGHLCMVQLQELVACMWFNPFVTSGTYMSHLQRVFSSPLGWQCPTFFPCCHLPWSILLNQSECIFPQNSRVQMILCAMLLCIAALHTVS